MSCLRAIIRQWKFPFPEKMKRVNTRVTDKPHQEAKERIKKKREGYKFSMLIRPWNHMWRSRDKRRLPSVDADVLWRHSVDNILWQRWSTCTINGWYCDVIIASISHEVSCINRSKVTNKFKSLHNLTGVQCRTMIPQNCAQKSRNPSENHRRRTNLSRTKLLLINACF